MLGLALSLNDLDLPAVLHRFDSNASPNPAFGTKVSNSQQ
jgi:hypothetical protein